MRIIVHAKPDAYEAKIEKIGEHEFRVSVVEPPVNGLANLAIIKAIADYFGVSPLRVILKTGHASRQKILEVK